MSNSSSLKKYLFSFITLIITLFSSIFIILCITVFSINHQYTLKLHDLLIYTELSENLNQAHANINSYVEKSEDDVYVSFQTYIDQALELVSTIKGSAPSNSMYYSTIGLENLITEYASVNSNIHDQLSKVDFSQIYPLIKESQKIYTYISTRTQTLALEQSAFANSAISKLTNEIRIIILSTIIGTIVLFFFILSQSVRISQKISEPIQQIVDYSRQLSRNNFESPDIKIVSLYEIEILCDSLNYLKRKINEMLQNIKQQSKWELELKETQVTNLKISNELKATKLQMLQAQINPHFLFNTLNSIHRLALENRTDDIIELNKALSDMLRYNLDSIHRPITLNDELNNLKNYIYIQKIRFKNKLNVIYNIHCDHLDIPVPCLIFQPIVENSIIHGLKPYDYDGDITIDIHDEDKKTIVVLSDTGVGIPAEKVQQLNQIAESDDSRTSSENSIGYRNVVGRIEAFQESICKMHLASEEGLGTTVTISIERR